MDAFLARELNLYLLTNSPKIHILKEAQKEIQARKQVSRNSRILISQFCDRSCPHHSDFLFHMEGNLPLADCFVFDCTLNPASNLMSDPRKTSQSALSLRPIPPHQTSSPLPYQLLLQKTKRGESLHNQRQGHHIIAVTMDCHFLS